MLPKGYKHSIETRKKIALGHLGKKGYPVSIETRRRISEALKGNKHLLGHHHSLETRQKISKILKGKRRSLETRTRMSVAQTGNKKALGCKRSEITLRKMREAQVGRKRSLEFRKKLSEINKGERGSNWKGGLTPENLKRLSTFEWHDIRRQVYKRDNYTCQCCRHSLETKKKISEANKGRGVRCNSFNIICHHKIPWRISKDDSMENLVTLCSKCHGKIEANYYRSLKNYKQGELF